MPLRALRLFQTTEASSLSFFSTLQLAAGQAWSRRVLAHASPNGVKRGVQTQAQCQSASNNWRKPSQAASSRSNSSNRNSEPGNGSQRVRNTQDPSSSRYPAKLKHSSVNVSYFDPQSGVYEPSYADMSSILDNSEASFSDIPSALLPHVVHSVSAEPIQPIRPSLPPTPTSRGSLYRNLIYLLNNRKPILRWPALFDYHALYPHLHSTASYNLLIGLCLRHRSLGIIRHLFEGLRMNNLPKNMDTYKLEVRWLIYRGLWNNAWKYIQSLKDNDKLPRGPGGQAEIPYPLWLELCRPIRRRRVLYTVRKNSGKTHKRHFETAEETAKDLVARQRLLNEQRPSTMPALANTKPFAVHCLVRLLIRTGKHDRALDLTKAYLKAIPRTIDAKTVRRCLGIIHAHIVATSGKNALAKFYQSRRTLVSLLKLHPRLRPNSRTLYLLLHPLARARPSGSVAWKVLCTFKSQWGPRVEDRRVQRRVAQFALKEGRMDVVEKMIQAEQADARYRRRRLLEEKMTDALKRVTAKWRMRLPFRNVYPRNGREARLWYRLRARTRRKAYQRRRANLEAG